MKVQDKFLENDLYDTEISNLTDKKFKVIVIKIAIKSARMD